MMRPVLLRQGWRCVEDGGDNYWSYRRYEKVQVSQWRRQWQSVCPIVSCAASESPYFRIR